MQNSSVWKLASCVDPVSPPEWWASRWDQPEVTLPAGDVEWWAVTHDPDALLAMCHHVRRLNPEGQDGEVGDWDLEDEGPWSGVDAIDDDVLHWTDGGLISRPIPAVCAEILGLPGDVPTVPGTWRAPYHWEPQVAGEALGVRAWQPVIAPWVRQPD